MMRPARRARVSGRTGLVKRASKPISLWIMQVDQSAVLDALKVVTDPDLHRDIVSLGFIKDLKIDGGHVRFTIELTTPACPVKDQMRDQARAAAMNVAGVSSGGGQGGARGRAGA